MSCPAVPTSVMDEAAVRELFPIKLVGGFLCVDQHVGCAGCRWCLSRRHRLWSAVFDRQIRLGRGAFDSPELAHALLQQSRAFNEAKVPLRFGHNTDARFQWAFGQALYQMIPEDIPFIFMTRFPVPERYAALFKGQPNLICKLSICPPSSLLANDLDPRDALASVARLPLDNIYFLIGPVAADSLAGARKILHSLPEGAWADVKPLTRHGIPGLAGIPVPPEEEIASLRAEGTSRGLVITDYFGCQIRRRLGRAFYKTDDVSPYVLEACRGCSRWLSCHGRTAPGEETIRVSARGIGLSLGQATRLGPQTTRFECPQPASRGDETFLSELHDHRVLLEGVPDGSQGGSFCKEDRSVLRRWAQFRLLPSQQVGDLARRIADELTRRLQET